MASLDLKVAWNHLRPRPSLGWPFNSVTMTACTSPHCVDNILHLLDLLGSSQQLPDVMFIVYHGQTDTCFSCHVSGVTVTAPSAEVAEHFPLGRQSAQML